MVAGLRFSNPALLEEALTHPSSHQTRGELPFHYQRLEFLGDAILGAVMADLLLQRFPHEPEGALAQRKSVLVSRASLVRVAEAIGLPEHIILSASEEASGGRDSAAIKEDVCEALIGALYLDQGFAAAHAFIATHWQKLLETDDAAIKDAKTALQEWAQAQGLPLPTYSEISRTGPAHAPEFVVAVTVQGFPPVQAVAMSKRKAGQQAAAELLALHAAE